MSNEGGNLTVDRHTYPVANSYVEMQSGSADQAVPDRLFAVWLDPDRGLAVVSGVSRILAGLTRCEARDFEPGGREI